MRYDAVIMQIEKDCSLEHPGDWDSLSDRMRKLRRPHQKTLLQQHKEAVLLADRKDALTKRPLDFDREEETRKGETMKWLESHFGSESTASNGSRDDDTELEPTKKIYFNVTIKSNQSQTATTANGSVWPTNSHEKKQQIKEHDVYRETAVASQTAGKSKYYQGISNWADRKVTPANHFASKAFQEDLQETVERNRIRKDVGIYTSVDKTNTNRCVKEINDTYVNQEDILKQKRHSLSSQLLVNTKRDSQDKLESKGSAVDNEVAERHNSGSRTDLYGKNIKEQRLFTRATQNDHNGNDVCCQPVSFKVNAMRKTEYSDGQGKKYEREGVEHGTILKSRTTQSPTHEVPHLQTSTLRRPTVPQRRRVIEKKLHQQLNNSPSVKLNQKWDLSEPPPDYSPPLRSRSSSPQVDYTTRACLNDSASANVSTVPDISSFSTNPTELTRKQNRGTHFASATSAATIFPIVQPLQTKQRPSIATQITQMTSSTISTPTSASYKSTKVGQVIGKSLRKLVSKIRSASTEHKLRLKSRSRSRDQSPATKTILERSDGNHVTCSSTSYRQYNIIDSHIGDRSISNESEHESLQPESQPQPQSLAHKTKAAFFSHSKNKAMAPQYGNQCKHTESADSFTYNEDSGAGDQLRSPQQRYYLGEDPYSSSLYGMENIYDSNTAAKQQSIDVDSSYTHGINHHKRSVDKCESGEHSRLRNTSGYTLGRFERSSRRFAVSAANLSQDYRVVRTLPRKLHEHRTSSVQGGQGGQRIASNGYHNSQQEHHTYHQLPTATITQTARPTKPARTYVNTLNRSKSFTVYGMNDSNDPSPIYIEKLTKNNYTNNNSMYNSQAYKSNPYLYSSSKDGTSSLMQSGLKSPSIVNLVSRSQKDLSKIGAHENERASSVEHHHNRSQSASKSLQRQTKREISPKTVHQQVVGLYKAHSEEGDYNSKKPAEIKMDKQSNIRREKSNDYLVAINTTPCIKTSRRDVLRLPL